MALIPTKNRDRSDENAPPRMREKKPGETEFPKAAKTAVHVRHLLMIERDMALRAAKRIESLVKRAGLKELEDELGADAADFRKAYNALEKFIRALDAEVDIPTLSG